MYGLVMVREYLDEILTGIKTCDVRAYDTYKRGTIALIDTKKSMVIGLINLIGTHEISADEYAMWHKTGKWKDCTFQLDRTKRYYAYDFEKPMKLATPIKIEKDGKVWCKIEEDIINHQIIQETLF